MPDEQPDRREFYRYIALGQVGLEMVSPIVMGVLLDRWLDSAPCWTVVGALIGFGGGMMHLLAILNQGGKGNGSRGANEEAP